MLATNSPELSIKAPLNLSPLEPVRLRLLEKTDLPLTLTWRNEPEIRQWFFDSSPIEWEQHVRWFESYLRKSDDYTFIIEAKDKPVGQIALYNIAENDAELGRVMIGREWQGCGYAHKAVSLIKHMAFEDFAVWRLYLSLKTTNMQAFNLYHNSGFIVERWTADKITMVTVHV